MVRPPQCGEASSRPLRAWMEQRVGERKNLALPAWWSSSVLNSLSLVFLVLGLSKSDGDLHDLLPRIYGLWAQTELLYWLSWVSSLHMAGLGLSAFHEPILITSLFIKRQMTQTQIRDLLVLFL